MAVILPCSFLPCIDVGGIRGHRCYYHRQSPRQLLAPLLRFVNETVAGPGRWLVGGEVGHDGGGGFVTTI